MRFALGAFVGPATGNIEFWSRHDPSAPVSLKVDPARYRRDIFHVDVGEFPDRHPGKFVQIFECIQETGAVFRSGDVMVAGQVEERPRCSVLIDANKSVLEIYRRLPHRVFGNWLIVDIGLAAKI